MAQTKLSINNEFLLIDQLWKHCVPAEQFVDIFCEKLEILRQHSFIAGRQAAFYNNCKTRLHPRECLVTVDFAENYTILQDAAQVFHLCCLLC